MKRAHKTTYRPVDRRSGSCWWLFPRLRGFWGEGLTIYSPPACFFLFFVNCLFLFLFCWLVVVVFFVCFFISLMISLHASIPLFSSFFFFFGVQDLSTVAQRAETTVAAYILTELRVVSPLRLRWVKRLSVFRCNLPPALLAE